MCGSISHILNTQKIVLWHKAHLCIFTYRVSIQPAGRSEYLCLCIEVCGRQVGGYVSVYKHTSRMGRNAFIGNFHAIDN
jgi:hypothetical protein